MLSIRKIFIILLAAAALLVSCSTPKDIVYFQNRVINQPEKIDKHAGIVIQPMDKISIVVSSRNPELVAMFNMTNVSFQAGSESSDAGGSGGLMGYVVDKDGYIDFPVLGPIKVSGLTRWELSELIKQKLIRGGLLSDAVVTVDFLNFKVSVLGEVNSPGTYAISGDKLNILQALSLAGDLTIYGLRENVTVIRERNGERTFYQLNLCDVDLFDSPAYYLQQNDIIYVEPNSVVTREATTDEKSMRMTSILVSSGSLLVSVLTLVLNLVL